MAKTINTTTMPTICGEDGCDNRPCKDSAFNGGDLCERHWDMAGDDNAVTDGHMTCHEFFVRWDEYSVWCEHKDGYHEAREVKVAALAKARAAKKAKAEAKVTEPKAKKTAKKTPAQVKAAKVEALKKAREAKAAKRAKEQAMMAKATEDHAAAKKARALAGMAKAAKVAPQVMADTAPRTENTVSLTLTASEATILKALLEREVKATVAKGDRKSFAEARVLETTLMDAIHFSK